MKLSNKERMRRRNQARINFGIVHRSRRTGRVTSRRDYMGWDPTFQWNDMRDSRSQPPPSVVGQTPGDAFSNRGPFDTRAGRQVKGMLPNLYLDPLTGAKLPAVPFPFLGF